MRSSSVNGKKKERGSVLAVSAFGMLTFLLAVGLCVDFSHFYVVHAELQNAADASALAGASALNSSPAGITGDHGYSTGKSGASSDAPAQPAAPVERKADTKAVTETSKAAAATEQAPAVASNEQKPTP